MTEVFNYIVARPWDDEEPDNLCIYSSFSEIQRGTMENAKEFLEYVQCQEFDEAIKYSIYKVTYEKV